MRKQKKENRLIKRKELTYLYNPKEVEVKLTKVVPFLLENELKKYSALYLEERI